MYPFKLSVKDYPSYSTNEQIWNLDSIYSLSKSVEMENGAIKYYLLNARNSKENATLAHFTKMEDRDRAYEDIYQAMCKPSDVKYFPA